MKCKMKELRKSYKLTQAECAARAQIDRSQWAYYESGKNTPNVYTAIKIAHALGVGVENVFRP